MKRSGLSLAPLDTARWATIRTSERAGFIVRAGLPIGLTLALVLDTVMLVVGGDGDLALSVWRLPRLALALAALGPVFGVVSGQMIWLHCERVYGNHILKEAFRATPLDDPARNVAPDAAER